MLTPSLQRRAGLVLPSTRIQNVSILSNPLQIHQKTLARKEMMQYSQIPDSSRHFQVLDKPGAVWLTGGSALQALQGWQAAVVVLYCIMHPTKCFKHKLWHYTAVEEQITTRILYSFTNLVMYCQKNGAHYKSYVVHLARAHLPWF